MSLDWYFIILSVLFIIISQSINIIIGFTLKKGFIILILYIFIFILMVFIGSPLLIKENNSYFIYSSSVALLIFFLITLFFTTIFYIKFRKNKRYDLFILLLPLCHYFFFIPYCNKLGLVGKMNNTNIDFESLLYIISLLIAYMIAKLSREIKIKQFFCIIFLLSLNLFIFFVFESSIILFLYPYLTIGCFILFFVSLLIVKYKGINYVL